jgi:hypothetical protein
MSKVTLMKLPSVSEIERQIREFRSIIPTLRRAGGFLGGTTGATCTVCLWILGDDVLVGDVEAEVKDTHSGYGSEVVPRLGVAFDVKAAARRLREAAEKGPAMTDQTRPPTPTKGTMKKVRLHVKRGDAKPAEQPKAPTNVGEPPVHTKPVTAADVFRFQRDQQHGMVLRGAEDLLDDVQNLVARLKSGGIPINALNISMVGRVLTDHAKLVALADALEIATKTK